MIDLWLAELVADNFLDLLRVERNDMPSQMVQIHVSRAVNLGDRWIRFRDHFCPAADVGFVDLFDVVLQSPLYDEFILAWSHRTTGHKYHTAERALMMKLWNSNVVPKNEVMMLPNSAMVTLLSSSCRRIQRGVTQGNMSTAYDVEERSDNLHIWRDHAVNFLYLAFVVFEQYLLACDRVRFFAPYLGNPFCTCPHSTGNIVDMHGVRGVLSGSPEGLHGLLDVAVGRGDGDEARNDWRTLCE